MRLFHSRVLQSILIAAALVVMLIVASFGVSAHMETIEHTDGMMAHCVFMMGDNTASICPMNIFDHLQTWQKLFIALPLEILALVILGHMVGWYKSRVFGNFFMQAAGMSHQLKRYLSMQHILKLVDSLIMSFSKGLLRPKLY